MADRVKSLKKDIEGVMFNAEGQMVVDFSKRMEMAAGNTFFQK